MYFSIEIIKVCNLYINELFCILNEVYYFRDSFIIVLLFDICGVIQDEVYEIVDLSDFEYCLLVDRRTMREQVEIEKFDLDYYM